MGRVKYIFVVFSFLMLFIGGSIFANDAEYTTSANEIVPLESVDVRLDKEVLNIKYIGDNTFEVDVVYRLFNEGSSRETVIGFEAPKAVYGNGHNDYFDKPYNISEKLKAELEAIDKKLSPNPEDFNYSGIMDFKVEINNMPSSYDVVDVSRVKNQGSNPYVGYLYYFPVTLKHGINKIHQHYKCSTSSSVMNSYEFEYILSTAKQWKGGEIKDFRLNFDMGEFADFILVNSFFNNLKYWRASNGKIIEEKNIDPDYGEEINTTHFYLRDGKASFYRNNFIPESTIRLYSIRNIDGGIFDKTEDKLNYKISFKPKYPSFGYFFAKDFKSLKILKNLPFARRGASFKTKFISNYYKHIPWYEKNPKYKPSLESLTDTERVWLHNIEMLKSKILRNIPFAIRGYHFKDDRLNRFYSEFKWYKLNPKYSPNISTLLPIEKQWLMRLKRKRVIGDREFFYLLKHYPIKL